MKLIRMDTGMGANAYSVTRTEMVEDKTTPIARKNAANTEEAMVSRNTKRVEKKRCED